MREPSQSVTFQQNSFVYINGASGSGGAASAASLPPLLSTVGGNSSTFQTSPSSRLFTSTAGPSSSSTTGGGYHQHPTSAYCSTSTSMVPSSSISDAAAAVSWSGGSYGGGSGLSTATVAATRPRIVRLNSIEPNTVMFSTKDYPLLSDVSVPEIIDELERQFDARLCQVQGVRLTGNRIFICLSHKECLTYMAQYGFYVRGIHVSVMDISHDSLVICLIGVPHYITDSTITMLVGTFGICIGEVERRFYKGVDTGERYVRLKPKASCQIPDYVTVGGCKILVRVLTSEEVGPAFVLDSMTSQSEPANAASDHYSQQSDTASIGSGHGPTYRSKPGHCNGSINSPPGSSSGGGGTAEMPPPPPPLLSTLSAAAAASSLCATSAAATAASSSLLSPQLSKLCSGGGHPDSGGSSLSSLPSSPKIARSFRSRINVTLKSPPDGGASSSTYVPGDSVDGNVPPLPPPPVLLSPPHYRHPMDQQQNYNDGNGGLLEEYSKGGFDEYGTATGTIKRGNRESPSASSLRKYAIQNNTTTGSSAAAGNSLPKAESSLSINSVDRLCSMSDTLSKEGGNSSSAAAKRTSVVFEEPKGSSSGSRGGSSSFILNQNRQISTSKAVNGILRKGSLRGEEDEEEAAKGAGRGADLSSLPPGNRKSRKAAESRHARGESGSARHAGANSKHRLHKTEAAEETGDSSDKRSSRSRSNSTKSSKGGGEKGSKEAGSLALTRDLPWCGCWGNGCL